MTPAELAENPANWRTHPAAQIDALTGAIAEVGWAGACLFNERTNRLVDGHARRKVAIDQRTDKIPVLVGNWTDEQEKKILATLDPLSAMAEANKEKLDALLKEVQTSSPAMQAMLDNLGKESGLGGGAPDIVEDEVPEPPEEPVSKPSDMWILGRHRLLCGDSTKAEDVARVMGGERASCVFTDPPYGVSVGAKNRLLNSFQKAGRNLTDIVDDDITPEELEQRLLVAFTNVRELAMAEDCSIFVCSPQGCGLGMMMMMMMQKAGLKPRHVLIWKKNQPTFSMGRLDYDYAHEPILLTWGKRHKRPMLGKHRTSVWEIDKPRASPEHPTMKPVELYANAYLNNSEDGDNVFDPYSGSGTALVAAEQLDRRCFAIEIAPQYVDVAVQRWEKLTGSKATVDNGAQQ